MHVFKSNVLMKFLLLALTPAAFTQILMAQTLTHWTRPANGPVIAPNRASVFTDPVTGGPTHWEALHTFNPAAVVRDGRIVVIYRAEDDSGPDSIGMHVSRLGLATSTDGIHFTRQPEPVFFAANDEQSSREVPGGVEDPRIVEAPDGTYVMTYTQWSRKRYAVSVGIATSTDLIHWKKQGPAFGDAGKYAALLYKSAGIVTKRVGDKLVAARINGSFWMYWGAKQVRIATSTDLIHWKPLEDASGQPLVVLDHRDQHPDSGFPEVGPPPLLTLDGIVLLYNAMNSTDAKITDPELAPGTYSVMQAVFDPHNPAHLLSRTSAPIFRPELLFERTGQYAAGTTFAEGLVWFHNAWWLYYGCADSFVGVAVSRAESNAATR
jgi:beta-1,2-mannosidase